MGAKRKPARLVAEVEYHEPQTQVSPEGELQTVHRADLTVTDRSSGQRAQVKGALDVPHTWKMWT